MSMENFPHHRQRRKNRGVNSFSVSPSFLHRKPAAMPNTPRFKSPASAVAIALLAGSLTGCVANGPRYNPPPTYDTGYDRGYPDERYRPPPPPRGTVAVARATYGSWQRSCDATPAVAAQASGKHHARIHVDNNLCGDPHQNTPKSLSVSYYCGGQIKTSAAREHDTATLSCP